MCFEDSSPGKLGLLKPKIKYVHRYPNDRSIAYEFNRWVRANGRVLRGLQRRRKEESELYFS